MTRTRIAALSCLAALGFAFGCNNNGRTSTDGAHVTADKAACTGEKACSEGKVCSKAEACCHAGEAKAKTGACCEGGAKAGTMKPAN